MKKIITLVAFITPVITFSQKQDSARYYRKQMEETYKRTMDSMKRTPAFVNYMNYQRRHNNYFAQSLFFNALHSDYAQFNNTITAKGFPALKPMSYGFGIGFCGKWDHLLSDFEISLAGVNKSNKTGQYITSSLLGIGVDVGYDVLSSANISLYPYAGLSLREASLEYKQTGVVNTSYTDITDLVTGGSNIYAVSTRVGYKAGLGIDIAFAHNKNNTIGYLFFVKGGVNQPIGKDKYKVEGVTYDPRINKGDWMISAGLKFTRRWSRPD